MRLAPALLCLGLAVPGLRAETWEGALARLQAAVDAKEGREAAAWQGVTRVEPGTEALEVVLAGPDLAPRLLVKVPVPGQPPEVASVVVGQRLVK